MSGYFIEVGNTCAAAFITKKALFKALPFFAYNINVRIKKGQPELTRLSNMARKESDNPATRNYPPMLKPGDFKLDT